MPKLSYVRGFAPWGWVIGTGIYADDTAAILWDAAWQAAAGMLVVVALIGVLAAVIGRRVTRPLLALNRPCTASRRATPPSGAGARSARTRSAPWPAPCRCSRTR